MHRRPASFVLFLAVILAAQPALGQRRFEAGDLENVERYVLPQVDLEKILLIDEERAAAGRIPHYAVPLKAGFTPWNEIGDWELMNGGEARWRLRIASPGALSLNLAFRRFRMPAGGTLVLHSADGRHRVGPFSERDNEEHGELWTPPIPADELILELRLPVDELDDLDLELGQVFHGYAGFGDSESLSGDCHRDVACSDTWSDQARSVALISVAGTRFCTGFLVNNTALDGRPFFITASHCGVTARNAASVVVMWNHERGACGGQTGGEGDSVRFPTEHFPTEHAQTGPFQTGAILRAYHQPSDTLLLELDDLPDPAIGVFYAGWDRSFADPRRTTVIHHPNTDVKKIGFDFDRAETTPHLRHLTSPEGDHLRIQQWDLGSTEGGSSGAPLFNQDGRVVGQLHGGFAACGDPRADWFGRFSAAWTGRGRPGLRLSDWLDPTDTGAVVLDGVDAADVSGGGE